MQKEKRKRGKNQWIFSLILSLFIILTAAIISPFLYGSFAPSPFATQPWTDPRMICTTYWFMFELSEEYQQSFRENFEALDLPLELLSLESSNSRGLCPDGDSYSELGINFNIEPELLADRDTLGNLIAEIVPAVAESSYGAPSVIDFRFYATNSHFAYWRMDFSEAQRAIAAGLRGVDLLAIGL